MILSMILSMLVLRRGPRWGPLLRAPAPDPSPIPATPHRVAGKTPGSDPQVTPHTLILHSLQDPLTLPACRTVSPAVPPIGDTIESPEIRVLLQGQNSAPAGTCDSFGALPIRAPVRDLAELPPSPTRAPFHDTPRTWGRQATVSVLAHAMPTVTRRDGLSPCSPGRVRARGATSYTLPLGFAGLAYLTSRYGRCRNNGALRSDREQPDFSAVKIGLYQLDPLRKPHLQDHGHPAPRVARSLALGSARHPLDPLRLHAR